MVAFKIFDWPIYRYGIFYLMTFVTGYFLLFRLGKRRTFISYPNVHHFLTKGLDDLMLVALLGVIVGGRLGHVFLYERSYFGAHLGEIFHLWDGGMSFVGGVVGVTIGLIRLMRRRKMSIDEFLLLGDIILCIVPIGIALGRIGNYLNQELRGRPLHELSEGVQSFLTSLGATHVYDQVDTVERVNTNLLQSAGEGVVSLLLGWGVMVFRYFRGRITPGLITGMFLVWYGIFRFLIEELKELPALEQRGVFSVSQRVMLGFFIVGKILIVRSLLRSR